MSLISLSGYTSISQWVLFLGIALIIFGIIEKRDRYILAGQIAFIFLGILAMWILFTESIHVPTEKTISVPKEVRILTFCKGVVLFMTVTLLSLFLRLFKLPFQKTSVYFLVFFALLLFFMLFNIMQIPNSLPSS